MAKRRVVAAAVAAAAAGATLGMLNSAVAAVQLGQIDNFQDGTVQNWAGGDSPSNISTGGPAGAGDMYLQITSFNHLATFNATQWAGDYSAAGITAISVDFLNPGTTPADMRLVLFGPSSNHGDFTSLVADVVPPDDVWHPFVFSLNAADLIQLAGDSYAATLADVTQLMFRHDVTGTSGGSPFTGSLGIDNVLATTATVNSTWLANGGGSWGDSGNWTNAAVPQTGGDTANFAAAIAAASNITLDGDRTVGVVTFNSLESYTISQGAGGSLILNNGSAVATVGDSGGKHFIAAPVVLSSNAGVDVANGGDSLSVSGNISGAGGLTLSGAGVLALGGSNSYSGGTAVASGTLVIGAANGLPRNNPVTVGTASTAGVMQLGAGAGAVTVSSLTINSGSTVDLTNNAVLIAYGSAANDPFAALVAQIATGYNGGKWTGTGITSSTAAANPSKFAVGYLDGNRASDTIGDSIAANQMKIAFTLAGDAFLEGSVGFDDLVVVAQNFGFTGKDWAGGNFNDDPAGSVGFEDLVSVAQNFGFALPSTEGDSAGLHVSPAWQSQTAAAVPEARCAGLAAGLALGVMLRRRRCPSIR